jgi:hypothetical protein
MKQTLITFATVIILLATAYACSLVNDELEFDISEFDISEIVFEEHSYLVFGEYGRTINVVHNPKCGCYNK